MRKILLFLAGVLLYSNAQAQETFPRNDVLDERANAYAFVGATIVVDPQTTISNGTLLIRDGRIEQVGQGLNVPSGYITVDVNGKYIYPSFVDIYSSYGIPEVKRPRGGGFGSAEQIESKTKGPYNANEAIKADYQAVEEFHVDAKEADAFRKIGFGSVLSFRKDGIARGTSTFVTLAEKSDNEVVLNQSAAAHYSFNRGTSRQLYPSSFMGFIALLRQTYMDASWYARQNPKPFSDITLEAFLQTQSLPQIFETSGWLTALRADKVGDEFGVQYTIRGGGDEYQRLDAIKATGASLIIPVNYPKAHDVEDPFDAERVSLADMKHWEMAPANAATLSSGGITFAFTSDGLSKKSDFLPNVRKAIEYGLPEDKALAALTTIPAGMVRMGNEVGSLKRGMQANFIITSDRVFADKAVIYENWVQGTKYQLKDMNADDYAGSYDLKVGSNTYNLVISGAAGSHKASIEVNDTTKVSVTLKQSGDVITMGFEPSKGSGRIRLSGWSKGVGNGFAGEGQVADGTWVKWSAAFRKAAEKSPSRDKPATTPEIGELLFPFVAHGNRSRPTQQDILIKNATVWTNEAEGIVTDTDVLLQDGKISKIGKNLSARGAVEIDGTGKHLTPGVIDEHSHIGASAINDRATNSSMVRIGDVINSEDVRIYRALAGGVTALQILHGSANPIGGQSALIKLRWGETPENMKIQGADGFIKFALGENVKRSTSSSSIRYPQTRMGVEQIFVDGFTNALSYKAKWDAYNGLSSKAKASATPPRRDLVHETMLDILEGRRFVSCHSYVQSEINMLMKVAERFNFRINTFTHILEGYKVADKMAAHGVGGSTFSDWWNYKWEVRYAIPYNAAIMHREGVVTAINSDDSEMIRRLNQEAAKTMKYGDLSEEEALKMVTLNPAKLLHLDDEMGSIKVGKSADVVLWSDHPLSVYAKSEKTIIDGIIYFDIEKDKVTNEEIAKERARLIQKMKDAKKNGAPTRRGGSRGTVEFHCDDDFEGMDGMVFNN